MCFGTFWEDHFKQFSTLSTAFLLLGEEVENYYSAKGADVLKLSVADLSLFKEERELAVHLQTAGLFDGNASQKLYQIFATGYFLADLLKPPLHQSR